MIPCVCGIPRPNVTHLRCECWHHDEPTPGILVMAIDERGTWFLPQLNTEQFRRLFENGYVTPDFFRETMGFNHDRTA